MKLYFVVVNVLETLYILKLAASCGCECTRNPVYSETCCELWYDNDILSVVFESATKEHMVSMIKYWPHVLTIYSFVFNLIKKGWCDEFPYHKAPFSFNIPPVIIHDIFKILAVECHQL